MVVSPAARTLTASLLLLAFVVISLGLLRPGLSFAEAEALWAVQGSQRPPEGLAAFVRQVQESLTQALERARESGQSPLYIALLDAWTQVAGDSVFSMRLLAVLLALPLLALTSALTRRWLGAADGLVALILLATSAFFMLLIRQFHPLLLVMPPLALLLAAGLRRLTRLRWLALWGLIGVQWIAVLLLASTPDWNRVVQAFTDLRHPTEPAIMLVGPRHPLHFSLEAQGILLDLGWRAQTPDSLARAVAVVEHVPVLWVLLPGEEPALLDLLDAAGFAPDTRLHEGDVVIYRLIRDEAPR